MKIHSLIPRFRSGSGKKDMCVGLSKNGDVQERVVVRGYHAYLQKAWEAVIGGARVSEQAWKCSDVKNVFTFRPSRVLTKNF